MIGRIRPAVLALAAVLTLTGCAGTAPAAAQPESSAGAQAGPRSIAVEYADGTVTGDTGRVRVDAGAPVTITVTSDVADEVHLHGYDLEAELTPGEPAEIGFDAALPGVFELELHESGTVLLTLQVG